MADNETALTEFELECRIDVKFDAADIVRKLTPMQVLELINQLDDEVDMPEFTVLIARDYAQRVTAVFEGNPDLAHMPTRTLEDRLDRVASQEAA